MSQPRLIDARHPSHTDESFDWQKWRSVYEGGRPFRDLYLKKYNARETNEDFQVRKDISPIPAFAKAAVNDVKNAVYKRFKDIRRIGGHAKYQFAVNHNIDNCGTNMNTYVGRELLHELLVMRKVGVLVDMPVLPDRATLSDTKNTVPYIYHYPVEDILSWSIKPGTVNELKTLLLKDNVDEYDMFGLVTGVTEQYRFYSLTPDGKVSLEFRDKEDKPTNTIILNIPCIPFVVFEISDSLLKDTADYQIAHLNIASSDIAYIWRANFPFYIEQVDFTLQNFTKKAGPPSETPDNTAKDEEINVGPIHGRKFGKGMLPPDFIAPPTEPLKASMDKQEQLKEEIRALINLSLSNIKSKMASAESKALDNEGLENGLASIAFELQYGENRIAQLFAYYLGSDEIGTVAYPDEYTLNDPTLIDLKLKGIYERIPKAGSNTLRKELMKEAATLLVGNRVSVDILDEIHKEIDSLEVVMDPDTIFTSLQEGVLSRETATVALGYPKTETGKAQAEHIERLKYIAASQSSNNPSGIVKNPAARGLPDLSTNPAKDAALEKT